jgi:polysaccharide biosynthesis transport protein
MQSPLSRYVTLAKRWMWVIVLGIVLCGGAAYVFSKSIKPVYQASAQLVVNLSSTTTPYDVNGSLAIAPTYAQLLTSSAVLNPVVAKHPGMTLTQLSGMVSVKPQSNTQIIELDVQNADPVLSMQLANEISQSLNQFANTRLSGGIQVVPAELPTAPISPKASLNTGIGALVGLALAVALIVLFEWIDDRLRSPEEVQELLGLDTLAVIPQLSRKQRHKNSEDVPALAEGCRMLCANLNAAQVIKPFKLVMVTSALAGEGRSSIAANLASFLAVSGKRVLLVDADLRRPGLHQHFQLDNRSGLSGAFLDMWMEVKTELDGQPTEVPTLRVLTAGVLSSNPAELLQSPMAHKLFDDFKKASQFDYVIFDTPPLLPVADAQILASYVQVVILVVDASRTPRKMLLHAMRVLSRTRVTVLGVVINKSRWSEDGNISGYLNDVWQRRPRVGINMNTPPNSPPVKHDMNHDTNQESKDVTLILAHLQKDEDN